MQNQTPAVETVPGRLTSRPVVKGSRMATDTIPESEELGETAYNYGFDLKDVLAVQLYYNARHNKPVFSF